MAVRAGFRNGLHMTWVPTWIPGYRAAIHVSIVQPSMVYPASPFRWSPIQMPPLNPCVTTSRVLFMAGMYSLPVNEYSELPVRCGGVYPNSIRAGIGDNLRDRLAAYRITA